MAKGQIVQWGNSLALRIPKPLAEEAGLRKGDRVTLQAAEGGLAVQRLSPVPTLDELVSQINPKNRYAELPVGHARGQEAVEW
jgi:antitoxin MazE